MSAVRMETCGFPVRIYYNFDVSEADRAMLENGIDAYVLGLKYLREKIDESKIAIGFEWPESPFGGFKNYTPLKVCVDNEVYQTTVDRACVDNGRKPEIPQFDMSSKPQGMIQAQKICAHNDHICITARVNIVFDLPIDQAADFKPKNVRAAFIGDDVFCGIKYGDDYIAPCGVVIEPEGNPFSLTRDYPEYNIQQCYIKNEELPLLNELFGK